MNANEVKEFFFSDLLILWRVGINVIKTIYAYHLDQVYNVVFCSDSGSLV